VIFRAEKSIVTEAYSDNTNGMKSSNLLILSKISCIIEGMGDHNREDNSLSRSLSSWALLLVTIFKCNQIDAHVFL